LIPSAAPEPITPGQSVPSTYTPLSLEKFCFEGKVEFWGNNLEISVSGKGRMRGGNDGCVEAKKEKEEFYKSFCRNRASRASKTLKHWYTLGTAHVLLSSSVWIKNE
jgi:hypothetical protein